MIKIFEGDNEEYLQCSSCLESNDNINIFKLLIGKSMKQITTIKLCEDCLKVLKNNIEELEGTDEIFSAVKEIVDKGDLGNKIEIVRMFSAAKRKYEHDRLKDKFEEKSGRKYIREVIVIDEKSAIVVSQKTDNSEYGFWYQPVILNNNNNILFETMSQALIGMVCLKTDNINASMWIDKMLGINIEN